MVRETEQVGVVVDRRALRSPWADHAWTPVAVMAGAPAAAPWTVLAETPQVTRYYAGSLQLEFHGSETGMYRDNLQSGRPSLWVSLRPTDAPPGVALHLVTADPAEAEALTEPGTDVIGSVPMPPAIQRRLAAFVAAHHVERPFVKRRRDRADPEAMALRVPGPPSKGKPR